MPVGGGHKNVFDAQNKKQGLHKYYSFGRVLILEQEYVDDVKHGNCKKYFTSNGTIREELNYWNGKKEGEYTKYNTIGKVVEEGSYLKGKKHGYWIKYNTITGEKRYEGEFIMNKKNGAWKYYNSKGALSYTGGYKEGNRDGKWIYYDYNGAIIQTDEFKEGNLILPKVEKKEELKKSDKKTQDIKQKINNLKIPDKDQDKNKSTETK